MAELDPIHRELFEKNAQAFQKHLEDKTKEWKSRIQKSGVRELVTYHKQFSYFCSRFDIKCELQLEPKPGIPPTTSHLLDIIQQMKIRKIRLVFIENLYDDSVAPKLRQEISDVRVERLPVSVDGEPGLSTNEKLIENLVKTIEQGAH